MLQTMVRRITRTAAALLLGLGIATRSEAQMITPQTVTPAMELARSIPEYGRDGAAERSLFGKITPSFSIAPRSMFRRRGPRGAMIDYSKQTVWLSANVHDVLPRSAKPYWPSALRLSAGRRGLGAGLPAEYVVGLDLDAARLPGSHPVWMQVKSVLHTLRLPGPAIVMGPNGTRALGLYW